jgi:spore coat polysaccharide biosynthesis predicted glycosyltransferase SpsG
MKVLIACHAGMGVGLGHLTRSLVIAKSLRAGYGASVQFLIQSEPLQRDDLNGYPHSFVARDASLLDAVNAQEVMDVVLLDLQPAQVPADLSVASRRWRAAGARVVAIDGLLACRPDLDLIFLPSFQFKPPADLQDGAPIVFGWDCFLMDMPQVSAPWQPGRQVLALTGGSDVAQLGATWPGLLDERLEADVTLHWVTGPFAAKPFWPKQPRVRWVEHVAPTGLAPLMQQVNYAVTVFGVSFFELMFLGVPTVVFSPYGGKDGVELSAIAEAGIALVAQDECEATDCLQTLMSDADLAAQLSARARVRLSVSGAQRLCSEVAGLMTH